MAQALVLIKDLVRAKTRLAGLLSPTERRRLAQAMLEDVLATLASHPGVQGITLVSDDSSAHLLAAQYGAVHWPEKAMGLRGLNAVAEAASARLLAQHNAPVLLVHADLPLLSSGDISAVLASLGHTPTLVIGCDRHGMGTNLLCFDAASMPAFCFGPDSCAGHMAGAEAKKIPAVVLRRLGTGLDVDEPGDVAHLLPRLDSISTGKTAACLYGTDLGARVRLALESLLLGDSAPGTTGVN